MSDVVVVQLKTGPTGATGPAGPPGPAGTAGAAGADKQVQFNDGGTSLGGHAGLTYDKTAQKLSIGKDIQSGAGASGPTAQALGYLCTSAAGLGGFAAGYNCQSTNSWCISLGSFNVASAAGAVAIGEECTASGTNGVAIGFEATASATYSAAIGTSCFATGGNSLAIGEGSVASRYGEMAHSSSGSGWNAEGLHALDMYATLAGASGALLLGDASGLSLNEQSLNSVTVRVLATKSGGTKTAHEVHELLVYVTDAGVLTILRDDVITNAAVDFAAAGWTVAIAPGTGTSLSIVVNPSTDTVQAMARVTWSTIGNTGTTGTFDPASSTSSSLLWWLRSDLGVTLSGSNVATWANQGNIADTNRDATAAGAAQPGYTTSNVGYNNRPTVNFTTGAHKLVTGVWSVALAQPFTVFLVGKHGTGTGYWLESLNGPGDTYVEEDATNGFTAHAGSSVSGTLTGVPSICWIEFNNASSAEGVNQTSATASGTTGTNGATGFRVGNDSTSSTFLNGEIAEILVYAGIMSGPDKSAVLTYLSTRYALTLAP